MPVTYDAIATTTVSTPTSAVTFSGISQNFTDLHIIANVGGSGVWGFRYNGDSSTLYGNSGMYASYTGAFPGTIVSGAASYGNLSGFYISINSGLEATVRNNFEIDILNYSGTSLHKGHLSRYNNDNAEVNLFCGTWRSTAAITSITFYAAGNFIANSNFTLYGIKRA